MLLRQNYSNTFMTNPILMDYPRSYTSSGGSTPPPRPGGSKYTSCPSDKKEVRLREWSPLKYKMCEKCLEINISTLKNKCKKHKQLKTYKIILKSI